MILPIPFLIALVLIGWMVRHCDVQERKMKLDSDSPIERSVKKVNQELYEIERRYWANYLNVNDDPAPTSPCIEDERQGDCPCPDEKNDPAKAESEIDLYSHYYTKEE